MGLQHNQHGASAMRNILRSVIVFAALSLTACGMLAVDGKLVPAAEATGTQTSLLSRAMTQTEDKVSILSLAGTSPEEKPGELATTPTSTNPTTVVPTSQQPTVLLELTLIRTTGPTVTSTPASMLPTATPPPSTSAWSGIDPAPYAFFPDPSQPLDANSEFDFGVRFAPTNSDGLQAMLLAFPIYAAEAVPTPGTCEDRGGVMPSTHPDRPFWSTGTFAAYPPGSSQTYHYSEPMPGATNLVLWLIVQNDGVFTYCGEQIYQFQ
jgi:hypothetical protein